jgi:hypothetical protein
MAWSGEHGTFVVEEFIQHDSSPIMMQHAFRSQQAKFPVLVSQQPSRTSPTATPQPQGYCVVRNFSVWCVESALF